MPKSHLSSPFFSGKSKETKKKDPFYTKTRLTSYLPNPISQKWPNEIIRFLKTLKILAFLSLSKITEKDPF